MLIYSVSFFLLYLISIYRKYYQAHRILRLTISGKPNLYTTGVPSENELHNRVNSPIAFPIVGGWVPHYYNHCNIMMILRILH